MERERNGEPSWGGGDLSGAILALSGAIKHFLLLSGANSALSGAIYTHSCAFWCVSHFLMQFKHFLLSDAISAISNAI